MRRSETLFYAGILSVALVEHAFSQHCPYPDCTNWQRQKSRHTMCQYPPDEFGKECENRIRETSLTYLEEKDLLNLHNQLRSKVASGNEMRGRKGAYPKGIINPLEWDDELATIAQRWANQCVFEHDKCRDLANIEVGQNLGYVNFSHDFTHNFSTIVMNWYNEIDMCNPEIIPEFKKQKCKKSQHFTQLIWGRTTFVGCGGVRYMISDEMSRYHLVCNYMPSGNIKGNSVYETKKLPEENSDKIGYSEQEELGEKYKSIHAGQVHNNELLENMENDPLLTATKSPKKDTYNYIGSGDLRGPVDKKTERQKESGKNSSKVLVSGKSIQCQYADCNIAGRVVKHTMCEFPGSTLGKKCKYVSQSSLSDSDKSQILKIHNDYRAKINMSAENNFNRRGQNAGSLKKLKWNDEIAKIAQQWANQCTHGNDYCRNTNTAKVGQNVYRKIAKGSEPFYDFSVIAEAWTHLVKHSNTTPIDNFVSNVQNDMYTQLVLENTTDIGCGGIKYVNTFKITYLVCNFKPTTDLKLFNRQFAEEENRNHLQKTQKMQKNSDHSHHIKRH